MDRNPKPHNQVSLAARSVKSKFSKLLRCLYDEIDERKRLRYYDELKQREKLEAREKQLDLINNTDAMEKLQQKIDEKLAAMARGENIEDHEYEELASGLDGAEDGRRRSPSPQRAKRA